MTQSHAREQLVNEKNANDQLPNEELQHDAPQTMTFQQFKNLKRDEINEALKLLQKNLDCLESSQSATDYRDNCEKKED